MAQTIYNLEEMEKMFTDFAETGKIAEGEKLIDLNTTTAMERFMAHMQCMLGPAAVKEIKSRFTKADDLKAALTRIMQNVPRDDAWVINMDTVDKASKHGIEKLESFLKEDVKNVIDVTPFNYLSIMANAPALRSREVINNKIIFETCGTKFEIVVERNLACYTVACDILKMAYSGDRKVHLICHDYSPEIESAAVVAALHYDPVYENGQVEFKKNINVRLPSGIMNKTTEKMLPMYEKAIQEWLGVGKHYFFDKGPMKLLTYFYIFLCRNKKLVFDSKAWQVIAFCRDKMKTSYSMVQLKDLTQTEIDDMEGDIQSGRDAISDKVTKVLTDSADWRKLRKGIHGGYDDFFCRFNVPHIPETKWRMIDFLYYYSELRKAVPIVQKFDFKDIILYGDGSDYIAQSMNHLVEGDFPEWVEKFNGVNRPREKHIYGPGNLLASNQTIVHNDMKGSMHMDNVYTAKHNFFCWIGSFSNHNEAEDQKNLLEAINSTKGRDGVLIIEYQTCMMGSMKNLVDAAKVVGKQVKLIKHARLNNNAFALCLYSVREIDTFEPLIELRQIQNICLRNTVRKDCGMYFGMTDRSQDPVSAEFTMAYYFAYVNGDANKSMTKREKKMRLGSTPENRAELLKQFNNRFGPKKKAQLSENNNLSRPTSMETPEYVEVTIEQEAFMMIDETPKKRKSEET